MLTIRMDFVKGDNLLLECFADRAGFRSQVLSMGMDFAENDNLLLECFTDGVDFRFHMLVDS